jgi:hypothetical protein
MSKKIEFDIELVDAAINYWFSDHESVRCPFPDYIKMELKELARIKFEKWVNSLRPDAEKEVNDEILAEKFEEILFDEAYKMVITEDEKITVKYPFMLRVGDKVVKEGNIESAVVERTIEKQGDTGFLKVVLEEIPGGRVWETSFELPE